MRVLKLDVSVLGEEHPFQVLAEALERARTIANWTQELESTGGLALYDANGQVLGSARVVDEP